MNAYELTAAAKDVFSGGTVVCSPMGHMFDIKAALDAGDGVIVTDDPTLSAVLDSYSVLKRAKVPEGALPVEVPGVSNVVGAEANRPWTPQRPPEVAGQPLLAEMPAVHAAPGPDTDPTGDPTAPAPGSDAGNQDPNQGLANQPGVQPTDQPQTVPPTAGDTVEAKVSPTRPTGPQTGGKR